jgi:16S rRNA G1207 methylase RsmC
MSNVIEGYFGPTKKQRMTAASYMRDLEATRELPYEQKFATLFRLCEDAASGEFDAVIIAYPETLGDNYEEMMRSLSLLAEAGLLVVVAGASPGVPGAP